MALVERPSEVIRSHLADAIAVNVTLAGEAFFCPDDGWPVLLDRRA